MLTNFCIPLRAVTDCTKILLQTIWRAEEYNIKNACVMQSHTRVIALLPAAHPVCPWLHLSYIRLRTYFKETPTLREAPVCVVTYTLHYILNLSSTEFSAWVKANLYPNKNLLHIYLTILHEIFMCLTTDTVKLHTSFPNVYACICVWL